jgi:hypothetical protein
MSGTYISAALRRDVIERAENCCEYCSVSQEDVFFSFEIDHIIAEKHGGETVSVNLCLSCPDCNAFKGSDLASIDYAGGSVIARLFNPRRDDWDAHFTFNPVTAQIEGRTPEGRVTVSLLRLNDPDRIIDRKLLINAGRYPCQRLRSRWQG